MKKYYLAYGSNLNIDQMKYRCPNAKVIGVSEIKNYQLLFKGSKTGAYLTIEKCKGEVVLVGVWEVSEKEELNLDRYEGYPNFYYKREIEIKLNNKKEKAFIYIMHEDRPLSLPSINYVKTCLEGYRDFGFNSKYLLKAINNSKGENYERNN